MSKYIKLDDAIKSVADQYMFEASIENPQSCDDIKEWEKVASRVFSDIPTIEVSEDCISREYTLNGLSEMADDWVINNAVQHGIYEAHDFVKDAPSAERLDQAMKESEE